MDATFWLLDLVDGLDMTKRLDLERFGSDTRLDLMRRLDPMPAESDWS